MNRLVNAFALVLAALFIAGCATSGATFTDMSSGMSGPPSGTGRIYFYRTSIVGFAVQPQIRLNGEVVGKARPKGFFYADRPAGDYEVASTTETEKKLTFTLAEGETKYVRLSIGLGFAVGRVKSELVEANEAKEEMASLHYIGKVQ
jgi:Protein of unknown function (DUF2846)